MESRKKVNFVVNGKEKIFVTESNSFSFAVLGNSIVTITPEWVEMNIPMRVEITECVDVNR